MKRALVVPFIVVALVAALALSACPSRHVPRHEIDMSATQAPEAPADAGPPDKR